MPGKREILQSLTRQRLLELAGGFDYAGLTGKSKEHVVDALVQARGFRLEKILPNLSREQLKEACRALGVSDVGRDKQVLIECLLGKERNDVGKAMTNGDVVKGNGRRKDGFPVEDLRHRGKRKNIPPAGIAAEGKQPAVPKVQYSYSPRRPPVLRWDDSGKADQLPQLLSVARERPLSEDEVRLLADALRVQEPWLEWAGKREEHQRGGFKVDPVALHIHERVSTQAVLRVAARQDIERSLFGDPEQAYHEAIQFYRHDINWANRLILGDSLQVMASLARREDLAGKAQMIYMDPPYGIRFASNFQPEIAKRDVKDREQDLTREPETVKAYRDTWHLGIHSYLTYLWSRLLVARDLLHDSGSIFVQINETNLHQVRDLLDQVFGPANAVTIIPFRKTSGAGSLSGGTTTLAEVCDYLLWYAKDLSQVKYRQLFLAKAAGEEGASQYTWIEDSLGLRRRLIAVDDEEALIKSGQRLFGADNMTSASGVDTTRFPVDFEGRTFTPHPAVWKTGRQGMPRLMASERLLSAGKNLSYVRYLEDFPARPVNNLWPDTISSFMAGKAYVVQTNPKVIERCVLMTTDPGDLVLDPTCGGGTTAAVAEMWGRRWITVDTSRVAIAITRQRLLTAKYEYFTLRAVSVDDQEKSSGPWLTDPYKQIPGPVTFRYKTVPHITLKSIAQNTNLDPVFAKHEPILDHALKICNKALTTLNDDTRQALGSKLLQKQKTEGKRSITDADRRRWDLPKKGNGWEHWQVPFDTDPKWPKELQQAVKDYRTAWRAKMEEVNATIATNAEREELVDQPEVVRGVLRVSGPFTVEAVQPSEESLGHIEERSDEGFDGAPTELPDRFGLSDIENQQQNVQAYLDQMLRLLRVDGVRFLDKRQMTFSRLDPLSDGTGLHGEGRWVLAGTKEDDREGRADVAVAFGPQYGPVTALQVEELIRTASRRGYEDLVVAGFSFDAESQTTIEKGSHPKLRIHMAHIRPDVNPGMTGLLKEQPGSQLFTVFGSPRTRVKNTRDGYVVKLEGVDIYDPVTNTISSSGSTKVAAWFIDGDYDGRTFCVTQAFFPNRDAWDKIARALSASDVIDSSVFEALSGTESLPFPAGKQKRVAIKVIDPRGNEVMQIHRLD